MDIDEESLIPVLAKRKSYRALSNKSLAPELVQRILFAASIAPSCANKQSWRFVVASEDPMRETVVSCLSDGNYWAKVAPVFVVACADRRQSCNLDDDRAYAMFDAGLAVMSLLVQASHEEVVAHPMAGFNAPGLREKLSIPSDWVIACVIALSYRDESAYLSDKHRASEVGPRDRQPFDTRVFYNSVPS